MARRRLVVFSLVAGIATILMASLGGFVAGRLTEPNASPPQDEPSGTATPNTSGPTEQQKFFERALNSRDKAALSRLARRNTQTPRDLSLPAGTSLSINWTTLRSAHGGMETVEASMRGTRAGRYLLVLAREGGTLRLFATEWIPNG